MYSMVTVIYGIPITEDINNVFQELDIEEPEEAGFETMYHGASDYTPGYCGVQLGGFDECSLYLNVKDLKLEPTQAQINKATKMYQELSPEIKKVAPKLGVYFVFHTS